MSCCEKEVDGHRKQPIFLLAVQKILIAQSWRKKEILRGFSEANYFKGILYGINLIHSSLGEGGITNHDYLCGGVGIFSKTKQCIFN